MTDAENYGELLDMPHHVSPTHPRMSPEQRAAQFSPFAALVGYEDAIAETARLTDRRVELDEHRKAELDAVLRRLRDALERGEAPRVRVTWFVPDARKEGGSYLTSEGTLRRIDTLNRRLLLREGDEIPVEDTVELQEM